MNWQKSALCRVERVDTELFYPVSYSDAQGLKQVAEARSYCLRCPVVDACLQDALNKEGQKGTKERHGIHGARTPGERTALSKGRHLTPAA
jgi:WhiB family redox-sensing transcriptional regulator